MITHLLYDYFYYYSTTTTNYYCRKPAEVLQREQQAKQERLTAPDEPAKPTGPDGDVDCKQQ